METHNDNQYVQRKVTVKKICETTVFKQFPTTGSAPATTTTSTTTPTCNSATDTSITDSNIYITEAVIMEIMNEAASASSICDAIAKLEQQLYNVCNIKSINYANLMYKM